MPAATTTDSKPARHRPKSYTVFAAAFLAGAAAAVGVNRVLDVQVAQRRPQVECEPIFVALRPLAQGSPVTVWDVALKDWPKAMLPTSALRAGDAFEGCVLRHAIREGQPLLAVQLVRSGSGEGPTATEAFVPAVPAPAQPTVETSASADLWTPAESAPPQPAPSQPATPAATTVTTSVVPPAPATVEPAPAPVVEPAKPPRDDVAVEVPRASEQTTDEAAVVAPPASEPTVVAVPEPTAADVASTPSESPTPTAPSPAAQPAAPTLGGNDDDASEAVATDVASMPSVMAAPATTGTAATRPTTNDAGRFLVVPERIALQADTSFTTPRPQPPGPPPTARTAPQARSRPQPRPTAPRTGQVAPQQMQQAPAKGQPQQRQQQPSQPQQSQRGGQTSAASKGWGGVFPNMAAGIEALGGPWQRGRSATGQPQRGEQSISR